MLYSWSEAQIFEQHYPVNMIIFIRAVISNIVYRNAIKQ